TGGMASKVSAANKVALGGVPTIIANGLNPGILEKIFSGEEEGTLFLPQQASLCKRKHWIVFTKSPKGGLVIDRGAEKALSENGKSLLPSGIRAIHGRFNRGNSVVLINEDDREVAVGLVNYNSDELSRITGARTSQIESLLGYKHDDEVIHRDNLVLSPYNR
ncbi:MAG: glutamate 5-kinase, partial [Deltaproteobacteria bacterium]